METKIPQLFCVGTNHKSAGLDYRENLYLSDKSIAEAIPKLIAKYSIAELLVLSTCNRIEVYGVSYQKIEDSVLSKIFIDLQRTSKPKEEIDDSVSNILYILQNRDCIEHSFNVTSGLDSLVLGETQITGQFKKATHLASEVGSLGPVLNRLTQEAFSTSKKVRTQTDIGKKPVSISHAAIDLANRVYGHINDHNVLVIGAGEMSSVAAKYSAKYSPKSLTIINRTLSKAEAVVDELGVGSVAKWEDLELALLEADVVISSTSASGFIISKETLTKVREKRNNGLFLIDIALPRDIDPECSSIEDVYLFDIDDLKQVVGANFDERKKAASEGMKLVHASGERFLSWINNLSIQPAIKEFKSYLDELMDKELTKTIAKLKQDGLSEDQQQHIESLLQSVSKKISGDAGRNLKSSHTESAASELASSLSKLFQKNTKDN